MNTKYYVLQMKSCRYHIVKSICTYILHRYTYNNIAKVFGGSFRKPNSRLWTVTGIADRIIHNIMSLV